MPSDPRPDGRAPQRRLDDASRTRPRDPAAARGWVPAAWRPWLSTPGSLTARLRRHAEHFELRVLYQGPAAWLPGERERIAPRGRGLRAHVREVALCLDGEPCVLARSIAAPGARRGPWRALRGLGTRPLAELLFGERHLPRSALHIDRLPATGPWRRRVEGLKAAAGLPGAGDDAAHHPVRWLRSRVYEHRGQKLQVLEMFLPALLARRPRDAR